MEANADAIQRELILAAPPERVWAALTQADALSAWFGTRASVDLRPGGQIAFTWDDPATGDHFTNGGVIEVVEAPHRFAFRWRPYAPPGHAERVAGLTTRVEFTLEPHPDGTRLRLVESGFAALPPDLWKTARDGNETGWTRELGELRDYVGAAGT